MANIKINELQPAELTELSDLELERVIGGRRWRWRFPRVPPCPITTCRPRF